MIGAVYKPHGSAENPSAGNAIDHMAFNRGADERYRVEQCASGELMATPERDKRYLILQVYSGLPEPR